MRSTRITPLFAAPLVGLALLTMAACGGSGESGSSNGAPQKSAAAGAGQGGKQPAAKAPATVSVTTAESELGTILVDDKGRTLYGFTKDKPGAVNCDAECIAVWPALTSAKDVTATGAADPGLLKETKLSEGVEQAVYGDWPLYYYVGDVAAGEVNGQGLDDEWFVIAADGKLVRTAAETE
ncbi:hypothetical protein [Streptomyces sp. NPDC002889]|uniref:COG4315 family predicted lipoprotein n=1 Tax=Streptomyces sp. NPDC002889 TaxID=3364669 RepID=UPI0036CD644A